MDWEELESICVQCRNCSLCQTRKSVVFGVGNREADVLFIGEGPGEQEDLKGAFRWCGRETAGRYAVHHRFG